MLSTSSQDSGDISETVSFTKTQSIYYRSVAIQTTLTNDDMIKIMNKLALLDQLNLDIQKINDLVFSSKLQWDITK